MTIKAQPDPSKAPTKVSVGKCTPKKILESATFNAQKYQQRFSPGIHSDKKYAIKNAPEVWPEGNEK